MSNLFNSIFNDATATASPLQLMLAFTGQSYFRLGSNLDLQIPNPIHPRICRLV